MMMLTIQHTSALHKQSHVQRLQNRHRKKTPQMLINSVQFSWADEDIYPGDTAPGYSLNGEDRNTM